MRLHAVASVERRVERMVVGLPELVFRAGSCSLPELLQLRSAPRTSYLEMCLPPEFAQLLVLLVRSGRARSRVYK